MKADLRAELDLLNRNVNAMIRLFQSATDAGLRVRQEAGGTYNAPEKNHLH